MNIEVLSNLTGVFSIWIGLSYIYVQPSRAKENSKIPLGGLQPWG